MGKVENPGVRVGNMAGSIFHAKGTQERWFVGDFFQVDVLLYMSPSLKYNCSLKWFQKV